MRLILALVVFALQVKPQNPPSNQATATPEQRGTEKAPFVIKEDSAEREEVAREHQEERLGKERGDLRMLIVTAILAAGTLGLWFATRRLALGAEAGAERQSRDMQTWIKVAQETAEASQKSADAAIVASNTSQQGGRAWVTFVDIKIDTFTDAVNTRTGEKGLSGANFTLRWRNVGRTPAMHSSLYADRAIVYEPLPKSPPVFTQPPIPDEGRMVLLPEFTMNGPTMTILSGDLEAWEKGKCKIFLYGRCDYRDVFSDEPRHFEVCLETMFGGHEAQTGGVIFNNRVAGTQNSAS